METRSTEELTTAVKEQLAKLRLKDMNALIPLVCHMYDTVQALVKNQTTAKAVEEDNAAAGKGSSKLKVNSGMGGIFSWSWLFAPEKNVGKTFSENFGCYGPFASIIRAAQEYHLKNYREKLQALIKEKEHLYVEVIKMRQTLKEALAAESLADRQREYLQAMEIILNKDLQDLQADLGIER